MGNIIKKILSYLSPLSISDGEVSISQADTETDGYLSSTDWNTFNGKEAGGAVSTHESTYVHGDIATNTSARHSHDNKAQLDLVSDGDHDVRTDNPHSVTKAQVGLSSVQNIDTTDANNINTDASGVTVQDSLDLKLESETDPIVGAVSGIVKADGVGNISAASAGTDYQAPLTEGTDYLAPDGDGSSLTGLTADQVATDTTGEDVQTALDAKLENIVEDTTPQLGGELDAGAHSIGFTEQDLTGDGTTSVNFANGLKVYFTFGAQNDTITLLPPSYASNCLIVLKQDGTGSRTVTWATESGYSIHWPSGTEPTLTTDGGAVDIISFYYSPKTQTFYGCATLDFGVAT